MNQTAQQIAPLERGARIAKTNSAPAGDTHPDGALGTVVETLGPAENGMFGYLVYWDDLPGLRVFVAGSRVRAISAQRTP